MKKILKNVVIIFILFLFPILCLGCGKYKSLPTAGMENIFGSNPEEAGRIFDVDFSNLEPEEWIAGNQELQIFTPEESFLFGKEKVRVSFYFLMNEYEGTAIGLDTVQIVFEEEAEGSEIADYVTETYGLRKPSSQASKRDGNITDTYFWIENGLREEETMYQEVKNAYEEIFGYGMTASFWVMEMDLKKNGKWTLYANGRPWALMRHMEDKETDAPEKNFG